VDVKGAVGEMNPSELEELISSFDKDRYFFGPHTSEEDAMKLQAQFTFDFPPAKILEMNIDDYVVGKIEPNTGQKNQNNFCYRIEFEIKGFGGIGGTPATKYGIYCDKKTQEYVYDKNKYDSPESAFKSIRSQIQVILDTGKKVTMDKNWSNFAQILEGDFDIQRHVRSKILSIYYPDQFLQMHSNKDAQKILETLFGTRPEETNKGLFLNQAKLLELKNGHPIMKKWTNLYFSTFIWCAHKYFSTLGDPLRQGLLEKNISKIHIDILKKFHERRGKYLRADEIYGEKKAGDLKKSPLPPDKIVNEPHYMHNLITGVYWLSGDEYALSIQLNPKSKWELEIDRIHPTLRINYDFGQDPRYKPQISKLENCYKNDVPIGIIFKTVKAKNKILGLGKIVSLNSSKFVIDSFGISEEESRLVKEETIKEFDESLADPEYSKIEEVNYTEFLSDISFNMDLFKQNSVKSPEPRRARINQIIDYCDYGEWVIPRFQRYFDWKKEDVRDFLRSIFLDYYVGALLLWDVRKETELDVMPINGVNPDQDLKKNAIVLDGQQRITSLYYAIKAPGITLSGDIKGRQSFFYIDFFEFFKSDDSDNLIKVLNEKIDDEESFKKMLFPFYKLERHSAWGFGLEKFLRKQESLDPEKILTLRTLIDEKLGYIYNGFEIPYVTLADDRSLEQVTEIFEKINSSGIQLDVFDLLIARLSKYNVKLRDLWEESRKNAKIIEYEGRKGATKMPIYILQTIALCFSKSRSCNRKDILDIYRTVGENKEDFEAKWRIMTKYTLEAISLLENTKDGFGVTVPAELPFEPMIPVLTCLLKEIDCKFKNVQKKCFDKLENWYWTSVFSVAYSSAVDSKKTSDFKEMMEWFSNDELIPKSIKKFRLEYPLLLDLENVEQQSNAIYRGVLCLIAIKGGYDFDKNRSVQNKRYHKDHIFPKSKFSDFENVNSIINMTWLTPDTNQPIKKGKIPSEYIEETIRDKYDKNEKEFLKTLESHFINYETYQCMRQNNFEKFIKERKKTILDAIGEKIGADTKTSLPSMTTPRTPYTNIRIIRNAIESCKEYVYWIDKYFAVSDLEILVDASKKADINEVKILISLKNADNKMRTNFKRFKEEMEYNGVMCEMRVVVDTKIYGEYHDRWLISSNVNYNLMSGEVAKRGQYAELKATNNRPPFEEWWKNSLDIISHWDDVSRQRNDKEDPK